MAKKVSRLIEENRRYLSMQLPIEESFDVLQRDIEIGGRASSFYFIDGFMKDEAMVKIMASFFAVTEKNMPDSARAFSEKVVSYVEVDIINDFDDIIRNILSGVTCLFIDGYEECIAIDTRTYPARGVDEPDKDKSLRGSRDGFVETIVFNTALMRRRIRDPHLVMKMLEVGKSSRSDVVVSYMEDRVDQELLKNLLNRIESLEIDDLRMNQQSLAEALFKRKWFNPFPKFKFTERPDTAAACLLEGKVAILVDNSPSAMILPTSILDMIEEANDYYFPTLTGIYLKISRAIITILTVFFTPLFLLFMQNPEWIPDMFAFIQVQDEINIPLIYQMLMLELGIDGLRLAAMNTPSMLSTPLSVIAGIVMGEFSVKSGWFNSEVMLYMAFVAVSNYTQPNFELGYALKFMRLLLLVLTAMFNVAGFGIGCVIIFCSLAFNKTLSGRNYLNIKLN
ncbi:spore germination protein [Faecalicatena sp. Marseille-Q4148]|nr:spore germination protein [Faecalicatena sp. Marseille-Q4148]